MSLVISKVFTYDTDAGDYIQRVEGASGDNQVLEPATRQAINNFVIGCKQDGIWNAIKASCILSGARTLAGALQPLAGTAPTNNGPFVSGDYNRKTGLVGNGSTKYLDSNRNNNADPQNSKHMAVYVSTAATVGSGGTSNSAPTYLGAGNGATGASQIGVTSSNLEYRLNVASSTLASSATALGFIGMARQSSLNYQYRAQSSGGTAAVASESPYNGNLGIFRTATGTFTSFTYVNGRLAFYSIGESLNLALLDARVTALITAFGVAIP
jgi:hypothetical protein